MSKRGDARVKVIKWLQDHWPGVLILIALVLLAVFMSVDRERFQDMAGYGLVCLTAVYAWATIRIARENRRTIEEMRQSRLDAVKPSLSLQPGDFTIGGSVGGLYLVNSGGVAKDVKIDIETAKPAPERLFVTAIDREHWIYLGTPEKAKDNRGIVAVSLKFTDGYGQPLTDSLSVDFANLKQEGREIKGQYSDFTQIARTLERLASGIRQCKP